MRAMLLSVFVMSILPAPAALWTSASAGAVDGGAGEATGANERGPSSVSGADVAARVEEDSVALCVVSCPRDDKEISCPDGQCQCYCDPGGEPVCKCG